MVSSSHLSSTAARGLLLAFDVADDPHARAFLADLITSGMAPPNEVMALHRLAAGNSDDGGDGGDGRNGGNKAAARAAARETKQQRKKNRKAMRNEKKASRRQIHGEKSGPTSGVASDDNNGSDPVSTGVSPFFVDQKAADEPLPPLPPPPPHVQKTNTFFVVTQQTTVLWPEGETGAGKEEEEEGDKRVNREPSDETMNGMRANDNTDRSQLGTMALAAAVTVPTFVLRQTPSRKAKPSSQKKTTQRSAPPKVSPFFEATSFSPVTPATPTRRARPRRTGCVSGFPVPSLAAPAFGLVQEHLAADPFWLLVALVFLTRVTGCLSLPVFWTMRARHPTPEALAAAAPDELAAPMRHLGMATVRCTEIQRLARRWLAQPPQAGVRTAVRNYGVSTAAASPSPTPSTAWEIGHLTQGPYFIDSWRIFCRDIFLGRSTDWKGDSSSVTPSGAIFQPEWMRVLPQDKELRACLRWMWIREGWEWDPETGDRTLLRETLRQAVNEGRVAYDDDGQLRILDVDEEGKVEVEVRIKEEVVDD